MIQDKVFIQVWWDEDRELYFGKCRRDEHMVNVCGVSFEEVWSELGLSMEDEFEGFTRQTPREGADRG